MYVDYNIEDEILLDRKKSGKEIDWRGKKLGARALARSYYRQDNKKKGASVSSCGNFICYAANPKNTEDKKYLDSFITCRDVLCPMCAERRSQKIGAMMKNIIDTMESDKDKKYRYIFLTLTVRNVSGDELRRTVDDLLNGFNFLSKYKDFKAMSKGWMRALEVTHNWAEDTYHPHIHAIIAVDEKYFTEYENYIEQKEWRVLWQKAARLDYDPRVDVRKVSTKQEKETIKYSKAVSELSKYPVKSTHYLVNYNQKTVDYFMKEHGIMIESKEHAEELTDRVVSTLSYALRGKRKVAFGGVMKEIKCRLEEERKKEKEVIDVDSIDTVYTVLLVYRFNRKTCEYELDKERSGGEVPKRLRYKLIE